MSRVKRRPASLQSRILSLEPLETRNLMAAKVLGDSFQINTNADAINSAYSSGANPHAVAADAKGNFTVVWSDSFLDGNASGIYARRYDINGNPLASQFRVNDNTSHDEVEPAVAIGPGGKTSFAWSVENYTGGYSYDRSVDVRHFSSTGVPAGNSTRIHHVPGGTGWVSGPQIFYEEQGRYTVVDRTLSNVTPYSTGLELRRYDSSGALLKKFAVDRGSGYADWTFNYGDVQVDAKGNLYAASTVSRTVLVPDVGYKWDYRVVLRRWNPSGTKLPDLILSNVRGDGDNPPSAGRNAMALRENGAFTVGWFNPAGDFVARDYYASGAAASPVKKLISHAQAAGHGFQHNVTITVLPSGYTVVAWNNSVPFDADTSYVREFDVAGKPTGPALPLDTSTEYLEGIEIDILAASRVVVSWNEITQDAGSRNLGNVHAQLFKVGSYGPKLAVGANLTYVENSPSQILASAATVSDSDSPNFGGGKLTVAIASNGTALDRLKILPSGKNAGQINLSGNQVLIGSIVIGTHSGGAGTAPLVVNLNVNATAARVQTLLRRIAFQTSGDNPATKSRTVSFRMTDGDGGISAIRTKLVHVKAVNDAPLLSGEGSISYTRGSAAKVVGGNIALKDPDSLNFAGGLLSLHIAGGAHSSNRLQIGGPVTLDGLKVKLDGFVIGEMNSNGGTGTVDLTIKLYLNATRERVQRLLRSITFRTIGSSPSGERDIEFRLTDGDGGTSNTLLRKVQVS